MGLALPDGFQSRSAQPAALHGLAGSALLLLLVLLPRRRRARPSLLFKVFFNPY